MLPTRTQRKLNHIHHCEALTKTSNKHYKKNIGFWRKTNISSYLLRILTTIKGVSIPWETFIKRADEARDRDVLQTSVDEHGQRRLLSPEQFQHLKQTGELDVPSELFENQYHTWKIAPGFYAGTQNVRRSFGEGFEKALDHYVVYTGDAVMKKEDGRSLCPTLIRALRNGVGRAGRLLREAAGQLFASRLRHKTHSKAHIDYLMNEAERYVLYHLREHDTSCLFGRDAYQTPSSHCRGRARQKRIDQCQSPSVD